MAGLPKAGIASDGIKYAVKYDRDWQEWQVRAYRKSKTGAWVFDEGPTAYCEDRDDAIRTFHHLVGYAPGYTMANPRRKSILARIGKKLYQVKVKQSRRNPTDIRQGPPRVVRAPEYAVGKAVLYAISGTPYGYLHRTDGSIRVWKTRSGAAKQLKKYCPL